MATNSQREAWRRALAGKSGKAGMPQRRDQVRSLKGIGPNKASGHKGGMGRQGSKRG